ncbi:MAG: hypothetical protein ABI140_09665 [Jatrophihabitantaceae bacterium]
MRTILTALAVAGTLATSALAAAAPAAALGGESFGCYVSPSHRPPAPNYFCANNNMPYSSYSATYVLSGLSGSYGYAWAIPAGLTSKISMGCTSTDSYCTLGNLTPIVGEFYVSVTISQGGQSSTLTADTYIAPWCGNDWCG